MTAQKLYITISIFFVVGSLSLSNVHAQNTNNRPGAVNQRIENVRNNINSRNNARCEVVESKVQSKITRLIENKQLHISKYDFFAEKIEGIIYIFEEAGLDVSTLKENVDTDLSLMVREYASIYDETIELLHSSQGLVCGENPSEYKNKLSEARQKFTQLKEKRIEIRTFYAETLRPQIKDLREQYQNLGGNDEDFE